MFDHMREVCGARGRAAFYCRLSGPEGGKGLLCARHAGWAGIRCLLIVGMWAQLVAGADPARSSLPAGLEVAIDRGLSFLQKQQKHDGSFDAAGPEHAMAGLATLAFLSAGYTPEVGKYGFAVSRAIDYLVSREAPGGYFGKDGGRMYSHCIVTLALAQAHGTEVDPLQRARVRAALERALQVICEAQDCKKDQNSAGGWRYEPDSPDSDLSVTGWCLQSLLACQGAGLIVPKQRIDRAAGFLLRCYRVEQGGFAYTPAGEPTPAMTAVGLVNLCLLDLADREEAGSAARLLLRNPIREEDPYWYYATYHATQAALHAGQGTWQAVWKRSSEALLRSQRQDDGSWRARRGEPGAENRAGRFYATAMACLTLCVPLQLLPIYQR